MFVFILGREYKLSIAEILSVFLSVNVIFYCKEFLLVDGVTKKDIYEKSNYLGGTIKIIELINTKIIDDAKEKEGKFSYGINIYGKKGLLKEALNTTKKELKKQDISSRFVNKDFQNLSTAQITGEKLINKGTDYNFLFVEGKEYFGKTIWIQDIAGYSKRDYGKERDMQTGMLPPKLAQMMINISGNNKKIYDPFVGLGTVLIEASLMGYQALYGSDLNEKMVEYSQNNLKTFLNKNNITVKDWGIEKLNSKFINESKFIEKAIDCIVTEGYLGEIMTQKNISIERIEKQKKSLGELYEKFFSNLKNTSFNGVIVISFPFWEMKGKYIYLTNIYDLLNKYCDILVIIPSHFENFATKSGSLLYKREKQLVGREIFKLKIKKSN